MIKSVNVIVVVLLVSGLLDVSAQEPKQSQAPLPPIGGGQAQVTPIAPTGIIVSADEDYQIGPGDVIELYVLRVPELSRQYRVNADGTIEMPFLGRIKAQKKTARELAGTIADGLRGDYLVDPQVSAIVQHVNRRFFIQGSIRNPGVYNIEGQPSLLELLSLAGGLNATYSGTAFIIRSRRQRLHTDDVPVSADPNGPSASDGQPPEPEYELRKANINALLRGDFAENAMLEPGDIVHIPAADVFFVAGEVKAPGSFPLKEGTTLRQAISLAQGTNQVAAAARAIIFREDASGQKREIPVDVTAVMRGRNQDVPIIANDIIVVPNNKTKSVVLPVVNAFGLNAAYLPLRLF
jgi:polysaccharide biosynthesis/export protein